jgi:hypothetical protein
MEAAADDTKQSALLPCKLDPGQRTAVLRHDAHALRALGALEGTHAYAAVMVPGFGTAAQGASALAGWLPGEACRSLKPGDDARFRVLAERARRGAQAVRGGVAPVVVVSGGAVHSPVVEAFALLHFLQCQYGVAPERVLLEPCAQHTHENLRNAGRFVVAIGGRAAYLVTDDGIQADYFQDWSGFEMILGSIDQRSLRDWGYLPGSWRQASNGIDAGFWFTPYRFWAEPRDGLGAFTCLDPAAEKW